MEDAVNTVKMQRKLSSSSVPRRMVAHTRLEDDSEVEAMYEFGTLLGQGRYVWCGFRVLMLCVALGQFILLITAVLPQIGRLKLSTRSEYGIICRVLTLAGRNVRRANA